MIPPRKKQTRIVEEKKENVEKKIKKKVILPFKGLITNEIEDYKKGVYNFFLEDVPTEQFICGCGNFSKSTNCIQHLVTHSFIVPRNSSHIILQKNTTKKYHLLNISAPDDGRTWWCPCRPGIAMNKAKFVNHVIYIHKGITPQYRIEHFRIDQ